MSAERPRERSRSENVYDIAPPLLALPEDDSEPSYNHYEIVGDHD